MQQDEHLEQLKLLPRDFDVLAPSEFRYYVVETVEDEAGRRMTLHSRYHGEGEAREAARRLFKAEQENHRGVLYGVGVVDMTDVAYMLTAQFGYTKP